MTADARSLTVSAALKMATRTWAISDKAFEASGTSRSGLFFEGAHYEKSPEAMPRARMTAQPAKM
jgi:hypothetical protein